MLWTLGYEALSASLVLGFCISRLTRRKYVWPCTQYSGTQDYVRPVSHGLQHYKETGQKIITDPAGQAVTGPFDVTNGVGKATKHVAADLHVSGEAAYLDDMPNTGYYGHIVGSTKSRARILSVDPSPALALEGVHGYFDHKDVEGRYIACR